MQAVDYSKLEEKDKELLQDTVQEVFFENTQIEFCLINSAYIAFKITNEQVLVKMDIRSFANIFFPYSLVIIAACQALTPNRLHPIIFNEVKLRMENQNKTF